MLSLRRAFNFETTFFMSMAIVPPRKSLALRPDTAHNEVGVIPKPLHRTGVERTVISRYADHMGV
jgi:hypothetical protein